MMYKFMFSIPVHEKTEVVLDQIINFIHFNPNCGIVLHLSRDFDFDNSLFNEQDFLEKIKDFKNVYVNPNRLRTALCDMIHTHISNFEYIKNLVDFEYFCLSASNEIFVKSGLENADLKDVAVGSKKVLINDSTWKYCNSAFKDDSLVKILSEFNADCLYYDQVEGDYFKKDIFDRVVSVINKYYDYNNVGVLYPREEVYFATVVHCLNINNDYSVDEHGFYTFVPWDRKGIEANITDIDRIIRSKNTSYYSVKRVDRDLNALVRLYVRNRYNIYEYEADIIGSSLDKKSTLSIKLTDFFRTLIFSAKTLKTKFVKK